MASKAGFKWSSIVAAGSPMLSKYELPEIRDSVMAYLIEVAVHMLGGKKALTFTQILQITKDFHGIEFPEFRVKHAFDSLIVQKSLLRQEPEGWKLSQPRQEQIDKQMREHEQRVKIVLDRWIEQVTKEHPELAAKSSLLRGDLELYIGGLLSQFSELTTGVLNSKPHETAKLHPKVAEILADVLPSRDETYRDAIQLEFPKFFANPDEGRLEFIREIVENNFLVQSQNLSDGDGVFNPAKEEMTLYLDTNAVISILGMDEEKRAAMDDLLEVARSLNAKVRITSRTKKEFLSGLERSKTNYLKAKAPEIVNPEKVATLLKIGRDVRDPFVRGFLRAAGRHEVTSWPIYYANMSRISDLLKAKGIETEALDPEIVDNDRMERIKEIVYEHGPKKESIVQEHDAYHYLLIQERRRGHSPWRTWFITFDTGLAAVDETCRSEEETDRPAFSMSPYSFLLWIDSVAPGKYLGDKRKIIGQMMNSLSLRENVHDKASTIGFLRILAVVNDLNDFDEHIILGIATKAFLENRQREERITDDLEIHEIDERLANIATTVGIGQIKKETAKSKELEKQLNQERKEKKSSVDQQIELFRAQIEDLEKEDAVHTQALEEQIKREKSLNAESSKKLQAVTTVARNQQLALYTFGALTAGLFIHIIIESAIRQGSIVSMYPVWTIYAVALLAPNLTYIFSSHLAPVASWITFYVGTKVILWWFLPDAAKSYWGFLPEGVVAIAIPFFLNRPPNQSSQITGMPTEVA